MKELSKILGNLLSQAVVEHGLVLPVYLVTISANGQVLALRYDQPQGKGVPLCEHIDAPIFQVPINLYFSDSHGEALRAVITAEGSEAKWVN